LREKQYSGFLPNFFTIEDLIGDLSGKAKVQGVALWLFAFEVYRTVQPSEDLATSLKWFPTLLEDWDDILKFSESDAAVLEYMVSEARMQNRAEDLGASDGTPRRTNLCFRQRTNIVIPFLKQRLQEKNWAASGMIHEAAKQKSESLAQSTE